MAELPVRKPAEELAGDSATQPTAEAMMQAGDVLSKSLIFALQRDYLGRRIFDDKIVRITSTTQPSQQDMAFLLVEQVGQSQSDSSAEYYKAIQTTLAACHDPRYALVFVVSSDGLQNKIYIGIRARNTDAQPSIFADHLGKFLCANWPGTRVRAISDYANIVEHVHVPLSHFRYAHAFTGIPSIKDTSQPEEYPQSLDHFMRGLRGKPYIYLVIADPMADEQVNEVISTCRSLAGQVQAFAKATIQRSTGTGTSDTTTDTRGDTETTGTSKSTTDSKGTSSSKGILGAALDKSSGAGKFTKGAGLAGISALLVATGGPFLLSGVLGMFGQLLPSAGSTDSVSTSLSDNVSTSTSNSIATSQGTSTTDSLSFGQEYLNKHAEACVKLLEKTAERFEIARAQNCWNIGVYLVSDQMETSAQAQAQFKALVSGEKSSAEPMRAHDLSPQWDGQIQASLDAFQHPPLRLFAPSSDEQVHHPLGSIFESLTTPLNTVELSLLANLPLHEMPGLPVQPSADFSLNPPKISDPDQVMRIGTVLEGGQEIEGLNYDVDINTLTRHIFITGITGSGKSNTCRRLLSSLLEHDRNFMVIEPAKDEYVQLALAYNQSGKFKRKIAVYMPGREIYAGQPLEQMTLNPFDIIRLKGANVQVMPHLDRLKSIFNASFPMYEILPIILEEALVDLYESQGWLEDKLPPAEVLCPTLEQMNNRISGLVQSRGYEERITDNITAAMHTRLSSLMRGWKGRMFNQPNSTPWVDLFDRPVVINLSQLGDDADKCFTMALLLNFMYEYRQAQHEQKGMPESSDLHHLAIIEEAHRILRSAHMAQDSGNPQVKMGEMFADILAEIRAYGQGLAIIDQVPSKLVPDALKNTNLKIVHRLVAADDCQSMASAMALSDEQAKSISRLKVGQAIVFGIQDDNASWVKVAPSPIPRIAT